MKKYVNFCYLSYLFLELEMFQAKVVEKIRNIFYVQQFFFQKIQPFMI